MRAAFRFGGCRELVANRGHAAVEALLQLRLQELRKVRYGIVAVRLVSQVVLEFLISSRARPVPAFRPASPRRLCLLLPSPRPFALAAEFARGFCLHAAVAFACAAAAFAAAVTVCLVCLYKSI